VEMKRQTAGKYIGSFLALGLLQAFGISGLFSFKLIS
jgi:hypothetical protein